MASQARAASLAARREMTLFRSPRRQTRSVYWDVSAGGSCWSRILNSPPSPPGLADAPADTSVPQAPRTPVESPATGVFLWGFRRADGEHPAALGRLHQHHGLQALVGRLDAV